MHSTCPQFKKEQHVERLQPGRFHREDIAGEDLLLVVPQERLPPAAPLSALRRWLNLVPLENITNSGTSNLVSQFEEFTLEVAVTPPWILGCEPQKQRFELGSNWRPSNGAATTEGPLASEQLAVPFQQRVRLEYHHDLREAIAASPAESDEPSANDCKAEVLTAGQARRMGMLAVEDAQLVAKQQDFKIFLVLRAPHRGDEVKQEREDASEGEVEHAGDAAWIVPRPGLHRRSEPTCNTLEVGHRSLGRRFRTLQAM